MIYDYIRTVVDPATKMVHLLPTKKTYNTVDTAELLFSFPLLNKFKHHSYPHVEPADIPIVEPDDFRDTIGKSKTTDVFPEIVLALDVSQHIPSSTREDVTIHSFSLPQRMPTSQVQTY